MIHRLMIQVLLEVGDAVDGDFVWDENSCIVNLSKEAAKKSEIVIPKIVLI